MDDDVCIALAIAVSMLDKKKAKKAKRKKRCWMNKSLQMQQKSQHDNLLRELHPNDTDDYRNILRMDEEMFNELLSMVTPMISKADTVMRKSVPAWLRLSTTLRYLATGCTFEDLKDTSAISPQLIGKFVIETCEAIINCLKNYIHLPNSEDEWKKVAEEFEHQWNFPNCIGVIGGKHVRIIKPPGSGSFYYNYNKTFSIIMMAVVNANYEFLTVDIGTNGNVSDGGVMKHTNFGELLENKSLNIPEPMNSESQLKSLPNVFVVDDAFEMSEGILKPYSGTEMNLTQQEKTFNCRLNQAQQVVENVFEILVSRFAVFQRDIKVSPEKAQIISLACCYLHNFLVSKSSGSYITHGIVDSVNVETGEIPKESCETVPTKLLPLQSSNNQNKTEFAITNRDNFCEYFSKEGEIERQTEMGT